MNTIRLYRMGSSGLHSLFQSKYHTLKIGRVLGKGGFGEVLECLALDGVAPQGAFVVKILGHSDDAIARNGYATIALLCEKVRQVQARRQIQNKIPLASIPGLAGLPLFHFEGEMNGQPIVGYGMYRLDAYGYYPLEDLTNGENPDKRLQYLHRPLHERLSIAVSFVKTLQILIEELEFFHSDINEPNLWIHRDRLQCALIDYDGGRFVTQTRRATTFGKMGEWLAPEIMQEAGKPQGRPWAQVSRESEYYTLWVAVSYLLFLTHPLFFLRTQSASEVQKYLARFKWPAMKPSDANWNAENGDFYTWFVQAIGEAPPYLMEAFSKGLCDGYFHPSRRLSPTLWYQVLCGTGKPPEISLFVADAHVYNRGEPMRLEWKTKRADTILLLPVKKQLAPSGVISINVKQNYTYRLEVQNVFGVTAAEVQVQVLPVAQSNRNIKHVFLNGAKRVRLAQFLYWRWDNLREATMKRVTRMTRWNRFRKFGL